jgi:Fe-S-cluster containining protein
MDLAQKSQAVMDLFAELESETKQFAAESDLNCLSGCGFCCANPKVPASPLEFLPLAFDLYSKGLAESSLKQIEEMEEEKSCIIYRAQSTDQSQGFCGNHKMRGMICRLFAASARRNKYGIKELIICKVLKEEKTGQFETATKGINAGIQIPLATSFYSRLEEIDTTLCQQFTINKAIIYALELVLRYQFYQDQKITSIV